MSWRGAAHVSVFVCDDLEIELMRGKPYATCSLGWTTQWHSDLTHIPLLHHCPWHKAENLKKNTEKGKPVALIKCRNQTCIWLLFWESVEMLSLIPCLNLGIWCQHVQWIVSVCTVHWAACCRPLLSICIHLGLLGNTEQQSKKQTNANNRNCNSIQCFAHVVDRILFVKENVILFGIF